MDILTHLQTSLMTITAAALETRAVRIIIDLCFLAWQRMKEDGDQPSMAFQEVSKSIGEKWKRMSGMPLMLITL